MNLNEDKSVIEYKKKVDEFKEKLENIQDYN